MDRILVVADLENNCFAIPRGLELADKLGFAVDVVAFTYAPLKSLKVKASEEAVVRKRLLDKREKEVGKQVEKFQQDGQKVGLKVVWEKNIDRWIIKQCDGGRYRGVIKTGNRTESLVHTSTDWQLLRECPVPVLLVAEKKWHRAKPVLVALDLSSSIASKQALNDRVLRVGINMADALGVPMEIITAIEVPTLLSDLDLIEPIAFTREAREEMKPQISKLAAAHDLSESAFHSKRGPVERVIASQAAKVRAQIVVMGTVARKGVKARLLGNTAEKVLRHLKTDVIAVKP